MFCGRIARRAMDMLLIASMIVGVWAFFAIVGNERQRRVQELLCELDRARREAEMKAQMVEEVPVLG
jgi:hypothetical protein